MEPEVRVKAFIADYLRAHQQLQAENFKDRESERFSRWKALVAGLDAAHGINRGCMALAGVIHGSSAHVPEAEPVVGIREEHGKVYVETCVKASPPQYYEYELGPSDGDWRIARIREFLEPADAPLLKERDRPRFTDPPMFPLRELPADDADADGDSIFDPGRELQLDDRTSCIEVKPVGRLRVTTGRLVVGDLGYDAGVLGVIGQSVPPGDYAVDVAVAFDRIAALRVRFSNEPVDRWLPADHNCGSSANYVVGVDAGNVAIMDLAAIMAVKSRDKERAFEAYTDNRAPRCSMLALVQPDDTVISDSGWGDGGYPVYWGVDVNRRPVVLVVDFMLVPRADPEVPEESAPQDAPQAAAPSPRGLSFIRRLFGGGP